MKNVIFFAIGNASTALKKGTHGTVCCLSLEASICVGWVQPSEMLSATVKLMGTAGI